MKIKDLASRAQRKSFASYRAIRVEMGYIYRCARDGDISVHDGRNYIMMLKEMAIVLNKEIEHEFAQKINTKLTEHAIDLSTLSLEEASNLMILLKKINVQLDITQSNLPRAANSRGELDGVYYANNLLKN